MPRKMGECWSFTLKGQTANHCISVNSANGDSNTLDMSFLLFNCLVLCDYFCSKVLKMFLFLDESLLPLNESQK